MIYYQTGLTKSDAIILSVKNLYVTLNQNLILENINFDVTKNKIFTIIGPNGAGKSTLIKTILGLIKPDKGIIEFAKDVKIGYIPQKFYVNSFLPINVCQFLKISNNDSCSVAKVEEQMHNLNIIHIKNNPLQKISGGEMQKVLLARALLKNPNFLILDEPAQGLDINSQVDFYHMLKDLTARMSLSIMLISHDLNFVMNKTDYVICLNKHICCQGTPNLIHEDKNFIQIFGHNYIKEFMSYKHNHNHTH